MQTIRKYEIKLEDEFTVKMPACARILCVQTQNGSPKIWAIVCPGLETVERKFKIRGTGHNDARGMENDVYVGTFQISGGDLVFHLFDCGW